MCPASLFRFPAGPDLADEIRRTIDRYVSRRFTAQEWSFVGPWIAAVVRDTDLPTVHANDNAQKHLAGLVAWCMSVGLPIERKIVFKPSTVERYIEVGLASESMKRTARSNLRRVALAVAPTLQPPAPPPHPRPRAIEPYSRGEIRQFLLLAAHQRTRLRSIRTQALICIVAGAGLRNGERQHVHAEHVVRLGRGPRSMVLYVPGPPERTVPVLAPFGVRLERMALLQAGYFLLGGDDDSDRRNAVARLVSGLRTDPDLGPLSVSRLRASWLKHHLVRMGFAELLAGMGVRDTKILFDAVRHLGAPTEDEIIRALRGQS